MFKDYFIGNKVENLTHTIVDDWKEQTIEYDEELKFYKELTDNVMSGERIWTTRFKPNTIRLPAKLRLPIIETDSLDSTHLEKKGDVRMVVVSVGHARDWPREHPAIHGSGWVSKEHMIHGLGDLYRAIYGQRLDQNSVIQAYHFIDFVPSK